jgi:endonuclease/exonuclease/phosphatase (EEP) superfamily protein YafD
LARLAGIFVGLTIVGLIAAAVLAELGAQFWWADLFGHFRFPYLMVAALAGIIALLVRPRWRALLVLLAAAPHLWAINTYPSAPWSTQSDTGTRLRVVSANLLYTNQRLGEAAAWLRGTNADIICLQEIVHSHRRLVAALNKTHPYFGPRHTRSDTVLFSRHAIVKQRVELPGEFLRRHGKTAPGEGYPYHVADIRTPGGIVRVICVHPLPPVMARLIGQHRAQFAAWKVEAAAARRAQIGR